MRTISTFFKAAPWGCLLLLCICFSTTSLQAQTDVILQGFYWNTHPGDPSDATNGGIWWDSLTTVSPELAGAGIGTIWAPPMTKGFGNLWDMGYGLYDYYDLGEYNQKGSTRTRHGTRAQLDNFITTAHNVGIKVMADIVLNHRGGGDAQTNYEYNAGPWTGATEYLIFNPLSSRFPGIPAHFHPNNSHPNQDPDYNDPLFFNDVCYFNQTNQVGPPGGWYFGSPPFGLGSAADSLIDWGRWLMNDVGFDEMRLDAVKHINPAFLAKFLVETQNGTQPFAVGEFFDTNGATLAWYRNEVESQANAGTKNAEMSIFDFEMRDRLKTVLDNTSGTADLYNTLGFGGMVWGHNESGFDVVTFLDNHDKDRIGFIGGSAQVGGVCPVGEIKAGNSCLILDGATAPDHDPVINDKEDMGYPLLMAAEGRPTVFWKDWFWFDLSEEIEWLISLRETMAAGGSSNTSLLNSDGDTGNDPFWDPAFGGNNNGGNMFAMMRWGVSAGAQDGMVLGLNDHPSDQLGMYTNTAFNNKFLKDYSDGFMFIQSQAFNDSRALIRANARDYSWWGLTGQYPHPPRVADPVFSMVAQPGGAVHWVVIDSDDAANLTVNGSAIETGDQIAIINASDEVCGIGRVGQEFGWTPGQDMLIEVLGPFPTDANPVGGAANGMAVGETFKVVVWDASAGQVFEASSLTFGSFGSSGTFNALRPATPGRSASFTQPSVTDASGGFSYNGISRITDMVANTPPVSFPVEWMGISATVSESEISLQWEIAWELDNAGFEVQLKAPGESFQAVGFVASLGDGNQPRSYQYKIQNLSPGRYQLRLAQIDLDGTMRFSRSIQAEILSDETRIHLYPNPADTYLKLDIFNPSGRSVSVQCIDVAGREIWQKVYTLPNPTHTLKIPLDGIQAGLYSLRFNDGTRQWSERFQLR